ncbi:hypothetical protein [Streptomyces sp. A0592]|uniref:hypothetical protein n=1 Tax=Streptomyces sp. A0592 TaxID=2563099 RepID=UPI00109EA536|nr:hypothetical protein [Streptomyces sp. A0592]THA86241.1 hypothetical protein E6U81_04430 [Streptomyces sp. A0592]
MRKPIFARGLPVTLVVLTALGCTGPAGERPAGDPGRSDRGRAAVLAEGQWAGSEWQLVRNRKDSGSSCVGVRLAGLDSMLECDMTVGESAFNVAIQKFPDGTVVAFGLARPDVREIRVERRGTGTEGVATIAAPEGGGPRLVVVLGSPERPVVDMSYTAGGEHQSLRTTFKDVNDETDGGEPHA